MEVCRVKASDKRRSVQTVRRKRSNMSYVIENQTISLCKYRLLTFDKTQIPGHIQAIF